jgi:2-phospho-L-lactate guanylyltransferase
VVIPVKGTADAKSRLGGDILERLGLAEAIALDTVSAALATEGVDRVLVVTSAAVAGAFRSLGAEVLVEYRRAGDTDPLNSALHQALAAVVTAHTDAAGATGATGATGQGVAVLLGDVPGLAPAELSEALRQASGHRLAMVADAEAIGTVMITAAPGATHHPSFGTGSRLAHRAAGYVELDIPVDSGLRRDVDTLAQLAEVRLHGAGPRTAIAG